MKLYCYCSFLKSTGLVLVKMHRKIVYEETVWLTVCCNNGDFGLHEQSIFDLALTKLFEINRGIFQKFI